MIKHTDELIFLASLMRNPGAIVTFNKSVSVTDFRDVIYYDIYIEIINSFLAGKNATFADLRFKFRDDPVVLDVLKLIEGESVVVDDLNVVYQGMVESAQRDRLKQLALVTLQQCDEQNSITKDILDYVESQLISITLSSQMELGNLQQLKNEISNDLTDKVTKFRKSKNLEDIIELPTGFRELDYFTLGFQRGASWVLGAATSDGKTQLAVQFASNIMKLGKGVLYFTLEDAIPSLVQRFLSLYTGINLKKLRCGDLTDGQLNKATETLSQLATENNLFIDDITIDINDILLKTKFAKLKQKNLSLIIVDYISLATDKSQKFSTKEQEISTISKKLIHLAKTCNVAVLGLSQLNTSPDDRTKGLPIRMNDIRDSKAPGHDSSVTLFINYPNKYNKDTNYSKKETELIVAKNRYGETNKIIYLENYPHLAKFIEVKHSTQKVEEPNESQLESPQKTTD